MSKNYLAFMVLLLGCMISSCGLSPTTYRAASDDLYGYHETQIADSIYRITFRGNAVTSFETVDRYALYRAAELSIDRGGNYFEILDDRDDKNTSTVSGSSTKANTDIVNSAQPVGSVFPSTTTATASVLSESYSATSTEHTMIKTVRLTSEKPQTSHRFYDAKIIARNMKEQIQADNARAEADASNSRTWTILYYSFAAAVAIVIGVLASQIH